LFSSLRPDGVSAEENTMTESFWWHLLAGFIIGFGVSTLWEWLYFRHKRTVIRDRYVAELEATVRTYAAAAAQMDTGTASDWSEPRFEKPAIFLETEESPLKEHLSEGKPAVASSAAASASPLRAAFIRSDEAAIPSASIKSDWQETTPADLAGKSPHSQPATTPFRSVAVQQPAPSSDWPHALQATQNEKDWRPSSEPSISPEPSQHPVEAEPFRRNELPATSHPSADTNLAERTPSQSVESEVSTFPHRQQHSDLTEAGQSKPSTPAPFSAFQERLHSVNARPSEQAQSAAFSQRQERSSLADAGQPASDKPTPPSSLQERPSLAEAAQPRHVEPSASSSAQEQPGLAEAEPSPSLPSQQVFSPAEDARLKHDKVAGSPPPQEYSRVQEDSKVPEIPQTDRYRPEALQPSFAAIQLERAGAASEQLQSLQETPRSEQEGMAALRPEMESLPVKGEQTQLSPPATSRAEASGEMTSEEHTATQRERIPTATVSAVQEERERPLTSQAPTCQHDERIRSAAPQGKIYTAVLTSRTEWMLLRIVQAMVQFVRQVRSAVAGEDAPRPASHAAKDAARCEDDLTRISGLMPIHAERLRLMGITRYAQVAALTVDELRRITFTPDATKPVDYEQWRKEAAALAASQEKGGK
jgi:predicted flap endonuclease-1-like 5' DNA nuclease